jgi:hypothetical protein
VSRLLSGTDHITASALSPTAATASIWIYQTSTDGYAVAFNAPNAVDRSWGFFLVGGSPNKMAIYGEASGGSFHYDPGSTTISLNTWYHLAFTYNSTSGLTGYVNGAVDGTAAASGTLAAATSLVMGQGTGGTNFPGRVADAAVWNTTLTAGEVLSLSQGARPKDVRPGSIIGYWPLDGLVSPEPDMSGGHNSGTLTGTSLAPGPPVMMFTPRWPSFLDLASPPTDTLGGSMQVLMV